jgi:hypothetical protein
MGMHHMLHRTEFDNLQAKAATLTLREQRMLALIAELLPVLAVTAEDVCGRNVGPFPSSLETCIEAGAPVESWCRSCRAARLMRRFDGMTEAIVPELRRSYAAEVKKGRTSDEVARELAKRFGVGVGAVKNCAVGKTWNHVPLGDDEIPPSKSRRRLVGSAALTSTRSAGGQSWHGAPELEPDAVREIRRRAAAANYQTDVFTELAEQYKRSEGSIRRVAMGVSYKHVQ